MTSQTERRHKKSLGETRDNLQMILKTAATAVFSVDAKMRVTSVNREFTDITGYSEQDSIGMRSDFLCEDVLSPRCGIFNPLLREPIYRMQCSILSKDGRKLTILKNADVTYDESGEITGGIESFIDVTELVRAREKAVKANKRLQESLKRKRELAIEAEAANRAKSEFLANMSHEIRDSYEWHHWAYRAAFRYTA